MRTEIWGETEDEDAGEIKCHCSKSSSIDRGWTMKGYLRRIDDFGIVVMMYPGYAQNGRKR
jgi:hypothetical protein